jgi:anti-sigma B factor antagonist
MLEVHAPYPYGYNASSTIDSNLRFTRRGEATMELAVKDLDSGVLGINLSGRMDIIGTQQIDLKFTMLASTRKAQILVDLSNVTFIASIGIRTLVSNAKAQKLRGGSMVLYKPNKQVEEVLKATGIDTIIPIAYDIDAARGAFGSA